MGLTACKEIPELLNSPPSLRQAKRQGKFRLPFNVIKSGFCEVGLDDRKDEITVSDTTLRLASMEQSMTIIMAFGTRSYWIFSNTFPYKLKSEKILGINPNHG
jgi:hypothetical protein